MQTSRARQLIEGLRGPGRHRAWRRRVLRRGLAAACAVAVVLGVVAVVRAPRSGELTPVVVAARPLAVGEVATPDALRVLLFPKHLVPDGAATAVAQVIGRPLTATLNRGEPVTTDRARPSSVLTGQPIDLLAFHVMIADVRSVSMVRPGDRIDLVGPGGIVARSAPVLATDPVFTTDFGAVLNGPGSSSGNNLEGAGLTVAVDQPTILDLSAAQQDVLGRPQLSIVLRPR
jgi:hypothetical protein